MLYRGLLRKVALFLLVFLLLGYIPVSTLYNSGILHEKVRGLVEKELSKSFRREITADKLTGNLVTSVQLHSVRIADGETLLSGELLRIPTLTVQFSLVKALKNKDFLAGIQTVLIQDAFLNFVRQTNEHWNLLDFVIPPPLPKGAPKPPPLSFKGKIIIKNMTGVFTDERGWSATPIKAPFQEPFNYVNGYLNFAITEDTDIDITAYLTKTKGKLSLKGRLNATNAQYKLYITADSLETLKWGPYLLPLEGFHLADDTLSVNGSLTSKPHFPEGEIPFFYNFYFHVDALTFQMPFFPTPLEDVRGDLRIYNTEDMLLEFHQFQGTMANIPVSGKGTINTTREKIDLAIKTSVFETGQLKQVFPSLKIWDYNGLGRTEFNVTGALASPQTNGIFWIDVFSFYGMKPESVTGDYSFSQGELSFSIHQGDLFSGKISGSGRLNFLSQDPSFSIKLNGDNLNPSYFVPNSVAVTGSVSVVHELKGHWNAFKMTTIVTGDASIYQQPFEMAQIEWLVSDDHTIHLDQGVFQFSGADPLYFRGDIQELNQLSLVFEGRNIALFDIIPNVNQTQAGFLTVSGALQAPLHQAMFEDPKSFVDATLNVKITDAQLFHQPFSSLVVRANHSAKQKQFNIDYFDMAENQSRLTVEGYIRHNRQVFLTLSPKTTVYLEDINWLKNYGSFSGELGLSGLFEGSFSEPQFQFNIHTRDLLYNNTTITSILGDVHYKDRTLLLDPLIFQHNMDKYQLKGSVQFPEMFNSKKDFLMQLNYRMTMSFFDVDVQKTNAFISRIKERLSEFKTGSDELSMLSSLNKIHVVDPILSIDQSSSRYITNGSLAFYQKLKDKHTADMQTPKIKALSLFSGRLSGHAFFYSRDNSFPFVESKLVLKSGTLGSMAAEKMELKVHTKKDALVINLGLFDGTLSSKPFQYIQFNGDYHANGQLAVHTLNWRAPGYVSQKTLLSGRFPLAAYWRPDLQDQTLDIQLMLDQNNIDILSVFSPMIMSMKNEGALGLTIKGTLKEPIINSSQLHLKNFELQINSNNDRVYFPMQVSVFEGAVTQNQLLIDGLTVNWKARDMSRQFKRKFVTNTLSLKGSVGLKAPTFLMPLRLPVEADIHVADTTLAIDIDDVYFGRLSLEKFRIKGQLDGVQGPLISGRVKLRDGRLFFSKLGSFKTETNYQLALRCDIEEAVAIQGGFFGDGFFSLANYFYLELSPTLLNEPLNITGSISAPKIGNQLSIQSGFINFFDRTFEILPEHRQRNFLKEYPEDIQKNTIGFTTDILSSSGQVQLLPVLHLKAISFLDPLETPVSQSSISTQKEYTAVLVLLKGRLDHIQDRFSLLEYKTRSSVLDASFPSFVRRYEMSFSNDARDQQSFYEGLSLITPQVFSDPELRNFDEVGVQQANILLRRNLRPYERRWAKRAGLYDVKIDYNLGQTLKRQFSGDSGEDDHLLGVNLMWDLMKERLFLRVKTDANLSESSVRTEQSLKLTEFELTYLFTDNISLNFNDISEYADANEFDPVFSLKVSREF